MVALLLVAYIIEMLIKHGFFVSIKSNIHYFRLHTLEKINHVSTQINQASDLAEQKTLLVQLKNLAEQYKQAQQAIVHPKKSFLDMKEIAYKPEHRLIIVMVFTFLYWYLSWRWFGGIDAFKLSLGFNAGATDKESGAAYSQILIAYLSLMPVLLVWAFRDANNYRDREISLRDVMFKEHKQLVEWATTEAKKDKSESNESTNLQTTEINSPMIQVAGIYQLAPFLKDHHANLYQRSTLETLRAIVNASRPKWEQWVKGYEGWVIGHKQGDEPEKPQLTAAERAVHAVLRENPVLFYHNHFNAKDFNLAGFDGRGLVLIGCDFQETMLAGSEFSDANLISANFKNSILLKSIFSRCCLVDANFEEANLCAANFYYLRMHRFPRIDVSEFLVNHLIFTCFTNANLEYSNLRRVIINPSFFIKILGAIVSEPNLVETETKLCEFAKDAIRRGAISIADKQIENHPLFETVKGEYESAIEELKEKGLTATTNESLAESSYPNMDHGLIND
jgi:hypothetical protein